VAAGERHAVGRVVTEAGPALNGHRREFLGLLRDPAVTVIVVERRDGFARLYGQRAAGNRAPRAVALLERGGPG
jgi:predicted site-specific integrase-resolvase